MSRERAIEAAAKAVDAEYGSHFRPYGMARICLQAILSTLADDELLTKDGSVVRAEESHDPSGDELCDDFACFCSTPGLYRLVPVEDEK